MNKILMNSSIFKEKRWPLFKDLLGITIGTIIAAAGVAFFLVPFKAAPGGVSSLSQIMYYSFGINLGTAMLLFNVPLFILGLMTLGRMFGFKTLFAIFSLSLYSNFFSSDFVRQLNFLQPYLYQINDKTVSFTNETFLGVLAGAMLLGTGLGLVFRSNGSCGSTDIPALLLRKYFGLTIGTGYLLIDTGIITISGIIFKDVNLILWGLFSLFITSKMADRVIQGPPMVRSVFIISDKYEDIRKVILKDINRGCTLLKAEGGFSGEEKKMIYTVTNIHELARLKTFVKNIDPKAFMIIGEVQDVHGQGFKLLS